jgi:DNA-binding transcriptional LysR family regulator
MEVFHAIMRAGSVTGAARMLNITQPAISTVLRHCESQLRVKLFDRVGGRLQPTPEANAIFPDIANIFQRVDTVTRVTQDLVGGRLGQITVAATFAAANGPLAAAVAKFVKDRPAVKVAIQALPSVHVVERVGRREADFGLAFAPFHDPAVESEVLAVSDIACILPACHPLAARDSVAIEELAGEDIITYAPHTPIGSPVEKAFHDAGVELRRRIQVNYSMTAFILAERGAGIALVEPFLLRTTPMPSLVVRPLRPRIEVRTMLVQPLGRPMTKTGAQLVAAIRQEINARVANDWIAVETPDAAPPPPLPPPKRDRRVPINAAYGSAWKA